MVDMVIGMSIAVELWRSFHLSWTDYARYLMIQ